MTQHTYIKIAVSLMFLLHSLGIHPMKKETQSYSDEICRNYRNLIFIIDHGSEVGAEQKLMLMNFIYALQEPQRKNACIITTAALWDHFLQATFSAGRKKFNARVFFDPTKWSVFKQCVEPDVKTTAHQQDCFYVFVPHEYAQRIQQLQPNQNLKNVDELSSLLGIHLGTPVPSPLDENGELAAAIKNQMLQKYTLDLYTTIGTSFIKFLKNFLLFSNVPANTQSPRYNVYITGHGSSAPINNNLHILIDQAQKFGYWPDERQSQASTSLKDFQEKASYDGRIAGLPVKNYAEMLELFNGKTNVLFVSSCQNGGRHLYMPFIFFSKPQPLSYTLIHSSLLDTTPLHVVIPQFYEDSQSAAGYSIASTLQFDDFFDGISDFSTFKKIITPEIKAQNWPDLFYPRLINYLANFMDEDGTLREIENVPWIKMPGATGWKLISEIDPTVRDITLKDVVLITAPNVVQPIALKDDISIIPLPNPKIYPDELKTISFDTIIYKDTLANFFAKILHPASPPLSYVKIPDGTIMRIKNLHFNNDEQEISVLPHGNATLHNCIAAFDSNKKKIDWSSGAWREIPVKSYDFYFSENNIFYGARSTLTTVAKKEKGGGLSITVTTVLKETPLTYRNAIARAQADQNNNLVSMLLQQSPDFAIALQTAQQYVARDLWKQGTPNTDAIITQHLGEFKAAIQKVLQEAKRENRII